MIRTEPPGNARNEVADYGRRLGIRGRAVHRYRGSDDHAIDHGLQLWAFSALAIFGVAAVAQTISAIFGGLKLLANLFIFVLALPSAGGTIPPEATPPLFRWLGNFEPMHQIYLGTRSILYFDGTWTSGLGVAVTFSAAAVVLGLVAGIITMRLYDRRGAFRGPVPSEMVSPDEQG